MTRISSEEALLDRALESPELAPFAMFTIDLPDGTPLWEVRSNWGSSQDHQRGHERKLRVAHQKRVEAMATRVAEGEPLFEEDEVDPSGGGIKDDTDTPDEWSYFWGGESPVESLDHWIGEE